MRRLPARRRGYTLIELLIALAILALVSTLAYRAVSSLTASEAQLAAEARRWRELDGFFARLEADLRGALPRPSRTDAGTEPAWGGDLDPAGNALLRFSRAGPEFALEAGSGGQRIGYRLREGAVEVLYWPRLDQPAQSVPEAYALAGGIGQFTIGYLDARGNWRDRWPARGDAPLPRAVRVVLTLEGGEAIERWLALQ